MFKIVDERGIVYDTYLDRSYLEKALARGYVTDGYDGVGLITINLPDGCKIVEYDPLTQNEESHES